MWFVECGAVLTYVVGVIALACVFGGLLLVLLLAAEPSGWEDDYHAPDDDVDESEFPRVVHGVLVTDVLGRRDDTKRARR